MVLRVVSSLHCIIRENILILSKENLKLPFALPMLELGFHPKVSAYDESTSKIFSISTVSIFSAVL